MEKLTASIITIGDELLIGQTIDTNSAFIGQEFNKIGIWVSRRLAVGDSYNEIWNALSEESKKNKIIIITGGLGPTADDITKPLLCDYFGANLVRNEQVLAHIEHLFKNVYKRPGGMLERNQKQADLPDNCTVLHNAIGTAPGMYFIKDGVHFFSLPGVPQEMKDLITSAVIPALERSFERPAILHRTIVTAGMGESMVAERLVDFEKSMPEHLSLAYLPSYGMVKLRLTAIGEDKNIVESSLQVQFEKLNTTLQDIAISDQDESIEKTVASLLRKNGKTIGTAESCTGGAIAALITSAPGSSAYFKGSIVSYANEIKINSLKVLPLTIEQYGAVSEQVVVEMAKGALQELNTDYAIATSGIMGPDGGTAEKPVGTIWIAVASNKNIRTHLLQLRFNRARNTSITVSNALIQLRKLILEESNS